MHDADDTALFISTVLHELVTYAEALLILSRALGDHAASASSVASPQKQSEVAVIIKSAALQAGLAAANLVGATERLRVVAEYIEVMNVSRGSKPS